MKVVLRHSSNNQSYRTIIGLQYLQNNREYISSVNGSCIVSYDVYKLYHINLSKGKLLLVNRRAVREQETLKCCPANLILNILCYVLNRISNNYDLDEKNLILIYIFFFK